MLRYDAAMLYISVLVAHIAGACATGLAASFAGVVLFQRTSTLYRPSAFALGILAVFQILSGVVLSIVSIQISAQSLCANIAIYLSVLFCIEAMLFVRMKKASLPFPLVQILSPVVVSLACLGTAIAYGF
jgi:hypothetical protein